MNKPDQPIQRPVDRTTLPENQVDVWCAHLPQEWDANVSAAYRQILTPEEAERYGRFAFEKDRRQFLLTRALVRDVLSRYVGVEPSALVFIRNDYGKPALAESIDCPISFSLSHTKGLSVCAVTSQRMIGVDVESLQRTNCHPDIARRFFAPSEAAFLDRFSGDQKRLEFLRLWTLKEAFIKALGLGLSIPLNSFTIETSSGRPPRVSFPGETHGNQADWRFLRIHVGNSFHIALASLMLEPGEIAIRYSTVSPLTGKSASVVLESNRLNEWRIDEV